MKVKGGFSSTMQSGHETAGPNPDIRGAEMSGLPAPFNKPHSTGPATIPLVFRQTNVKGESEAAQIESTMSRMKK